MRPQGLPTVMIAAAQSLDFGSILLDLGLVLIVAKLCAELVERIGVPAVIGEIVAGIAVGPSVLGLIEPTDALKILAEVGVIILLAEVGMEMDLVELRRVGRASATVALLGVALPMASGIGVGITTGESLNTSLFLGAALAATSVGITARVFGDLRALSSTEARIVLGAAVADDVLGLLILTVVTRIVQQGSIDMFGLLETIGLALGFLFVAGLAGHLLFPRLFRFIGERATSPATVGATAAGLTFLLSAAASSANLAPIIGAFVAGTALGRTAHHDRIARTFNSLGAVFIPVFFLQIGVDTDIAKFFSGSVLAFAAVLTVVAILGKVLAAAGAIGTATDKLVIGLGMMPRGEVGLIFASIGVGVGVFDDELYAVVLLVVLITTVMAPALLRRRLSSVAEDTTIRPAVGAGEPVGGWLVVTDESVDVREDPPASMVLGLTLEAALHAARAKPGDDLLDWVHRNRSTPLTWDSDSTALFLELLSRGNARSWRLLEVTGTIERALPEVEHSLRARRIDASELDPTRVAMFPALEALRSRCGSLSGTLAPLALAGFVCDLPEPQQALGILERLVLEESTAREARSLVAASALLRSIVSNEPHEPSPRILAQLADFLGTPLMVEWCRMLTEASAELEDWQFSVLLDVTTGVQELLAHPELIEGQHDSVEAVRRREALALTEDARVRARIEQAAAGYILAHEPGVIARHGALVEPAPRRGKVRVSVTGASAAQQWEIDVVTRDRRGLLARICSVLAERGFEVVAADVATWDDGAVLDTFTVRSAEPPRGPQLAVKIEQRLRHRLPSPAKPGSDALEITLDNESHPWHSVVTVYGTDRAGLLQSIATAFARSNVNVHHARISTRGGLVTDRFEVSGRHGRKIGPRALARVRSLLA